MWAVCREFEFHSFRPDLGGKQVETKTALTVFVDENVTHLHLHRVGLYQKKVNIATARLNSQKN